MGNRRRILGSKPQIAMADTHIAVNGCQVFLGHFSASKASTSAVNFGKMLAVTVARAKRPSLGDMYSASFLVRDRVLSGEPIFN